MAGRPESPREFLLVCLLALVLTFLMLIVIALLGPWAEQRLLEIDHEEGRSRMHYWWLGVDAGGKVHRGRQPSIERAQRVTERFSVRCYTTDPDLTAAQRPELLRTWRERTSATGPECPAQQRWLIGELCKPQDTPAHA